MRSLPLGTQAAPVCEANVLIQSLADDCWPFIDYEPGN